MNKFLTLGTLLFLSAAMVSCHNYEHEPVPVPVVEAAPNTLSGVITDKAGNPIAGVTVKLGNMETVTNEKGEYVFTDVPQGTYEVVVEKDGMFPTSATVNFTQDNKQFLVWSASMNRKVVKAVAITNAAVANSGEIESENIPNNEQGSVDVSVDVPANSAPAGATIYLTPIYTEESAAVSRAAEPTLLIGATLSSSDPNMVLSNPVNVTFALDGSVTESVTVKEYDINTDTWHNVNADIDAQGNVVIKTTHFTSFGIFLPVSLTRTSTSEPVEFENSIYDNRNGAGDMYVENAPFAYKAGCQIRSTAKNKLEGLLIEYLARLYGYKVYDMKGDYPLDMTLLLGQGVSLSGRQAVESIRATSERTSVECTRYGNVTVAVTAFSADHNGGAGGDF